MPSSASVGLRAVHQPLDRAIADEQRRQGDQDDLDESGQRFRLAVAEAVVGVGGHRGDPNAGQHDETGEQVEPAVGKRAEHRHRRGLQRRPGLQPDQEQRHGDARHRRARGQRGALVAVRMAVMMDAAHG